MPITKVSESRWQQAQKWELAHWLGGTQRTGIRQVLKQFKRTLKLFISKREFLGDDWNYWWAEKFDNYLLIPNSIECAIEIGCDPYTNMRIISEGRKIERIYCSDPLILEYIKLDGWLSYAYRKGYVFIDSYPAEECPYKTNLFDLLIMINVLDHVRDAEKCVQEAIRITQVGGLLVLGQDLTSEQDTPDDKDIDIGHPIRVTETLLNEWLYRQCEPLFYRILTREEGRTPVSHYGTFIYIGSKMGTWKAGVS